LLQQSKERLKIYAHSIQFQFVIDTADTATSSTDTATVSAGATLLCRELSDLPR
jgi:hypothetical protein